MTRITRRHWLQTTALGAAGVWATGALTPGHVLAADSTAWPPELPGVTDGRATIEGEALLRVPADVTTRAMQSGAAEFTMAKTPPKVELALHGTLGAEPAKRRLWSSWGDICVAGDGRAYVAIGDHGHDAEGDARCFVYRWDPKQQKLEQVVDMNRVVPPAAGQPAWSKVHAKIDEGADGQIYFSCTLNDGQRAKTAKYAWTERLPGGQLYQFDPASGQTKVCASLPPKRCTATSLLDRTRNIWWCNLEAGEQGDSLWGLDLGSRQEKHRTAEGAVKFNRNFALARDGQLYFNGDAGSLWRFDPAKQQATATKSAFEGCPGMRCTTAESKTGAIHGITHQTHRLFRYEPAADKLELLGANWLSGSYTAVCTLSPDERFVYYLPGAHGGAFKDGTPVVQYEVATGKRKCLAFLAPAIESQCGYVPAGTYGIKLSADGGTLYANLNGHPADRFRPAAMKPNGFGLCSFVSVQIPASERA